MRFSTLYQLIVVVVIVKIKEIYSYGKIYTTNDNKQYYIDVDQEYTWFDGLSRCLKMNMNLVSIETEEKSNDINQLILNTFGRNIKLWVGGVMTHYHDGRQYIWTHTGQPFRYSFWSGANPDFESNSEYCVQIGWGRNMEWNDKSCDSRLGYICEGPHQDLEGNNQESNNPIAIINKLNDIQHLINEDRERKVIWRQEAENYEYEIQNELYKLKLQLQESQKEKKLQIFEKSLQAKAKLMEILNKKLQKRQEQEQEQLRSLNEKYIKRPRISRKQEIFVY